MSRSFTCRPRLWVVAQLVELRTVTAAREGSTPFDPPKFLARNCGREVRRLIVDQVDDGSSPFSSAIFNFGVWCNVRIRVLGTRGDSSTLSSPTISHRWSNSLKEFSPHHKNAGRPDSRPTRK